jgi:hypothetical protein
VNCFGKPSSFFLLLFAAATAMQRQQLHTINFSGYTWQMKESGQAIAGPGPNFFSATNVSVDAQGRLHLAISYTNGEWHCAEVTLDQSLGYGTYRLTLDSDVSDFSSNIVFGFFTYNYNTPPDYQEIDIEFSNGQVAGAPTNWQYVIQPYYEVGNRTNFSAPASGMASSTHTFTWMFGAVYFESYTNMVEDQKTFDFQSSIDLATWTTVGQTSITADCTNVLPISAPEQNSQFYRAKMDSFAGTPSPFKSAWLTNGVPQAGGESIHLNLWLYQGGAPSSETNNLYEVIVSKFEFIPLASIQPTLRLSQVATNQTDVSLTYRSE